jgi:hypothetical protein
VTIGSACRAKAGVQMLPINVRLGSWLCKNALPEVSKRHDLVALREPFFEFG